METLHLRDVQASSAANHGSVSTSLEQLSSSKFLFFAASGRNSGRSYRDLALRKKSHFGAHRVRHPAYSFPLRSSCQPVAKLNDRNVGKIGEAFLLKKRGAEVSQDLQGKCIFLVGMMGSGKSTIGKVLADALQYQFVDSDKVIEEAAGGMSVAEFFKQQDEVTFREAETKALKQLSSDKQLVIATGGGIVVHPENWRYMRYGLSVWLDVPLESLAERVVAAGTHSRPLLGGENKAWGTSAYNQALMRLSNIFESRASCYANADAKVSVLKVARFLGFPLRDISPTVIAMQTLEEISELLERRRQD